MCSTTRRGDDRRHPSFSSIDYRFANTSVEIRNNLVRRITVRNGATGAVSNNVENTPATWFVNVSAGERAPRSTATGAQVVVSPAPPVGISTAPFTATVPKIGADEL